MIQKLYVVEKDVRAARGQTDSLKADTIRCEKSAPWLDKIKDVLTGYQDQVIPASPIGRATRHALKHWDNLYRFVGDSSIPIDNNALEREIRTVAIGRRNWTFCGSDAGGRWAARLYGLLGTCKLQGVNPHKWLTDVLNRVRSHPPNNMATLTPRIWATAQTKTADTS